MLKKLFGSMVAFVAVSLTSTVAFAQDAAGGDKGMVTLGLAIGLGLAVFGGALGQSRTASAALEGISRNPNAADKVFVPMILSLVFIESLVLFAWALLFLRT